MLGGDLRRGGARQRTNSVFLGWWESEVAFGEAVGVFLVGINEVLLDWGGHCDFDYLKYLGILW